MSNILVIGAHPDDIEIGAGGTIARLVHEGNKVHCVVVTVRNKKEIRIKAAKNAAQVLGCKVEVLDLSPEEILQPRFLTGLFDNYISDLNPIEVFTHWNKDSHQDHIHIYNSTISSCRKNKCSLYMYEQTVPGGVVADGFRPQYFVNISKFIDKKIESTLKHESQIGDNSEDWIRGIKGRAGYRGFQIGVDYAEVFEVVKKIKH